MKQDEFSCFVCYYLQITSLFSGYSSVTVYFIKETVECDLKKGKVKTKFDFSLKEVFLPYTKSIGELLKVFFIVIFKKSLKVFFNKIFHNHTTNRKNSLKQYNVIRK